MKKIKKICLLLILLIFSASTFAKGSSSSSGSSSSGSSSSGSSSSGSSSSGSSSSGSSSSGSSSSGSSSSGDSSSGDSSSGNSSSGNSDSSQDKELNGKMSFYSSLLASFRNAVANFGRCIPGLIQSMKFAYNSIDSYCKEKGYELQAGKNGYLYAFKGDELISVGDPVSICDGSFLNSEEDFYISVGKNIFSLERNYGFEGSFGKSWTSSLDSRIIRGYYKFSSEECYEIENIKIEELEDCLKKINSNINELSLESSLEAKNLLSDFCELKKQVESDIKDAENLKKELSSYYTNRNLNRYVEYGIYSEIASKIGREQIIYVNESGIPILLGKTSESSRKYIPINSLSKDSLILEEKNDGYELKKNTGEIITFDKYGVIQKIERKNGSNVIFSSNNEIITKVTLSTMSKASRSFDVFRNGRFITRISDKNRTVNYLYEDNNLFSVTDFDGNTKKYAYTSDNLLSKIYKADGTFISLDYANNDSKKVVSSTTNENGFKETFSFDLKKGKTTHKNYDGIVSEHYVNNKKQTILKKYQNGDEISFEYKGNLISKKTENGVTTEYEYNEKGLPTKIKYNDGSFEKFSYSDGNLIFMKDRDGKEFSFEYDEFGNLIGSFIFGEKISTFTYKNNNLVSYTDYFGNIRKYEYNDFDLPIKISLFKKNSTIPSSVEEYLYDEIGRVIQYKDSCGQIFKYEYKPNYEKIVSNDFEIEKLYSNRKKLIKEIMTDKKTGEVRSIHYEYDNALNLVKKYVSGVDSDKNIIEKTLIESYSYTPAGNVAKKILWDNFSNTLPLACDYFYKDGDLSKIDFGFLTKNGDFFNKMSTSLSYQNNSLGYFISQVNSDGLSTSSKYNEFKLVSLINGTTEVESNSYSGAGRLLKSKQNLKNYELNYDYYGFLANVCEIGGICSDFGITEYFANGMKKNQIDSFGDKTEYNYDEFGNISEIKNSKLKIELKYDSKKNLLSKKINSFDNKISFIETFSYDQDKRIVKRFVNGNLKETLTFNGFRNLISKIDANGNLTKFSYDVLGRKSSETNAYGNKTFFEYNANNQLSKIIFADKTYNIYEYDANGNLIKIKDKLSDIYCAEYDSFNRIISKDERPFSSPEKYTYDDFGRILTVSKNNIIIEKYSYSQDGKIIKRIDSKNKEIVFVTDGFGRILSKTNRLGNVCNNEYSQNATLQASKNYSDLSVKFEYSNGKIIKRTYSNGKVESAKYDIFGNVLFAKNDDNELQYTYDSENRLESIYDVEAGTRIKYTYDSNGNVLKIKSTGGIERNIEYSYGKLNEIIRINDFIKNDITQSSTEIKFTYDKLGRESVRKYKTGESICSFYDEGNRLVLQVGYSANNLVSFVNGTVFDENGHTSLSFDSNLNVTRYVYDKNGRLASVSYPYSQEMKSHFEKFIFECGTAIESNIKIGRLSIYDFEYAQIQKLCKLIGNGSLLVSANQSVLTEEFEYDTEGNLIKRKTPLGTVVYSYDEENQLVSFGKTKLNYDKNGNLTKILTSDSTKVFEYNSNNRINRAIIVNSKNEVQESTYAYDFFGRRIFENNSRTVYEGLGLKELYVLKSKNSIEKSIVNETQNSRGILTSEDINGRYIFISDEKVESNTKSAKIMELGSSAPVYSTNKTPILFSSFDKNLSVINKNVVMTNEVGTVKALLNDDETVSNFDYDALGFPINEQKSDYGFVGKRFDSAIKMYNFGYRDYSIFASRFSTVDPILDGRNWYSYCAGNPVDYVDFNGYEYVKSKTGYVMQDSRWSDEKLGKSDNLTIGEQGCFVTCTASEISSILGITVTPSRINSNKSFFDGSNLDTYAVAKAFKVNVSVVEGAANVAKSIQDNQTSKTEVAGFLYTSYRNKTDEKDTAVYHAVCVKGDVQSIKDASGNVVSYKVAISPSSIYDTQVAPTTLRGENGWSMDKNGVVYATVDNNARLYNFTPSSGGCKN